MASKDLDALDPLPCVLDLVKTFRTAPDDATRLAADTTKLKTMLRKARAGLVLVPNQDLSLRDQEEIIRRLQSRADKKRQLLQRLSAESTDTFSGKVKTESADAIMTEV